VVANNCFRDDVQAAGAVLGVTAPTSIAVQCNGTYAGESADNSTEGAPTGSTGSAPGRVQVTPGLAVNWIAA
jgi:hypothetical protein